MSALHPGGFRGRMGQFDSRIFGPAIQRACNQALKAIDHREVGRTSIATANRHNGEPHRHARESARRLRRVAQ